MSSINILFLEPRSYYEELGFLKLLEGVDCKATYGVSNLYSLRKRITRYDLVVTCIYHSSLSAYVSKLAKDNDVNTAYVMDGILQWENMLHNPLLKKKNLRQLFPIYTDIVFCTNKSEKKFIEKLGRKALVFVPKRIYEDNKGVEIAHDEKLDFLLSTANMAYFDEEEKNRLVSIILETVRCLKENDFTWACRIFDDEILEEVKRYDKNLFNDVDEGFVETSYRYKCLLTSPSSIAIPFIINKKPVGFFDYRDSPIFLQSGWRISGNLPIRKILASMLGDDKEERLVFQISQLEDRVEVNDTGREIINALESIRAYNTKKNNELDDSKFSRKGFVSIEYTSRAVYKHLKGRPVGKVLVRKLRTLLARKPGE